MQFIWYIMIQCCIIIDLLTAVKKVNVNNCYIIISRLFKLLYVQSLYRQTFLVTVSVWFLLPYIQIRIAILHHVCYLSSNSSCSFETKHTFKKQKHFTFRFTLKVPSLPLANPQNTLDKTFSKIWLQLLAFICTFQISLFFLWVGDLVWWSSVVFLMWQGCFSVRLPPSLVVKGSSL